MISQGLLRFITVIFEIYSVAILIFKNQQFFIKMEINPIPDQNNNEDCRESKALVMENINVLFDVHNSQFPVSSNDFSFFSPLTYFCQAFQRERLQVLKIKDCLIVDTILTSILNQLNKLETLEFRNVRMRKKAPQDPSPRAITSAKKLMFEHSDLDILTTIVGPSLTSVRLTLSDISPCNQIMFFLCEHKTISSLELQANSDIMNFFEVVPNYGFVLKHLSLITTQYDEEPSSAYEENFLNFLRSSAMKGMKSLEIKSKVTLPVLDFMLKHFRLLKTLTLKVNKLPQNPQFYTIKKPRKSIKELVITGPFLDHNTIISIFMIYPAVQKLSLCDYNSEFNDNISEILGDLLLHATEICHDLRELRVARMPSSMKHALKFKMLDTLQVAYINDMHDITKIISDNPSLETLIIDFVFRHQSNVSFLLALVQSGIKRLSICAEPFEIQSIHEFFLFYKGGIEELVLMCEVKEHMKTYEFKFSQESSNAVTSSTLTRDINCSLIEELVQYLDEL
jgi:hypothetical protein